MYVCEYICTSLPFCFDTDTVFCRCWSAACLFSAQIAETWRAECPISVAVFTVLMEPPLATQHWWCSRGVPSQSQWRIQSGEGGMTPPLTLEGAISAP